MFIKDYKIAYPDEEEIITVYIPVFVFGYEPIFRCLTKVKHIIGVMVIFGPVEFNDELYYRKDYTFFNHLN